MAERDTFSRMIEGSRGTLVFKGGAAAVKGEVMDCGEDYVVFEAQVSGQWQRLVVPVSGVAYFRYEDDD